MVTLSDMTSAGSDSSTLSNRPEPTTLQVVLPGYRGQYAANDFSDLDIRAADVAIASYLRQHTIWMPWVRPRRIILQVPLMDRDPRQETSTARSYQELFLDLAKLHWRQVWRRIPQAIALVLIGLGFLFISQTIVDSNMEESLRKTLSDAVRVGGWVAIWTAITLSFVEISNELRSFLTFRKLAGMPISFKYSVRGSAHET